MMAGRTGEEVTLSLYDEIVSPYTGIAQALMELNASDGEVNLNGYQSVLEGITPYWSQSVEEHVSAQLEAGATSVTIPMEGRMGHRMSLVQTRALVKALGETAERYASCVPDPSRFVDASYEEVADQAIHPEEFCHLSDREYEILKDRYSPPYLPYEDDAVIRWLPGENVLDGQEVLVPSRWVYMLGNVVSPQERFMPETSTGWAVANTEPEAVLTGIYENIERDSFMIAWMNKLSLPQVDLDTVDNPTVQRFVEAIEDRGLEITVLDSTTDIGIPSFIAIIEDPRPDGAAPSFGLSAHLDPEEGLLHAVEESAEEHLLLMQRSRFLSQEPYTRMDQVVKMVDHPRFYENRDHHHYLEFLFESEERVQLDHMPSFHSDTIPEAIEEAARRCKQAGLDVVTVDATPLDVRELGLHSVKTLVVGAQIHWYGHFVRALGGDRVYEAPVEMGYLDEPLQEEQMNIAPHPYA